MKTGKKIGIWLFICSLILTGLTFTGENAYAAPTANFSVSAGGNATLGSTVSVTVSVSGSENMAFAQVSLNYTSSVLEYQSGADSGGSGRVNLLFDCGSGQKSVSRTITFKAVGTGKASLSLDSAKATPMNASSGDWMNSSTGGGASVTVGESRTLSADAHVASIDVSPGTLQPAFNPDVFQYTMEVENDISSIAVTATASHQAAKITSVTGASDLKVGANKVSVVCTAENGGTAVYVITVTRKAASEEQPQTTTKPPEEETTEASDNTEITCELNGATYYIGQEFSKEAIPEGFEEADIQYQNETVKGAQFTDNNEIQLVYLLNSEKENGQFYIYYPASGLFSELVQLSFYEGSSIYLLDPSAYGITIPVDLMETVFQVDDRELPGYTLANPKAGVGDPYFDEEADITLESVSASPDQFVLLFGLAKDGGVYWYSYDKQEKTLQRLVVFASEVEEVVEETTTTDASESAFQKMLDTVKVYRIVLLGAAAIILLLIVLCVLIAINGKKKAAEAEEEDDDYNEEIEEKKEKKENVEATKLMPSKEIRKQMENQEKPQKSEKLQKTERPDQVKKVEQQEKPEKIEKPNKEKKPEKVEKKPTEKLEKIEKKPIEKTDDDLGLEFFDIDDL